MASNKPLLEDFIDEAEENLRIAELILLGDYNRQNTPKTKIIESKKGKQQSIVLSIEEKASECLVENFHRKFPECGILAEERTSEQKGAKQYEGSGCYVIQIDPLDGTREYINKTGEFVISCALINCKEKEPVAAAIYKPFGVLIGEGLRRELITAIKGQDSVIKSTYDAKIDLKNKFAPIKELTVSDISDITKCKLLLSKSHQDLEIDKLRREMPVRTVECIGSAGNKLITIAKGEAEAYIHFGTTRSIYEWDTSAGYLILKEAGGKITDIYGNPLKYDQENPVHEHGIIASNGKIHDTLVEKVNQILKMKN